MAISEQARRRGARWPAVMRFDDSAAPAWLESKRGGPAATEFWVMDQDRGEWIDARRAFYRPDQRTPMAYGFGAIRDAAPGSVDFETARRTLLERTRDRSADERP
jgi:hypothetical protein